MTDYVPCTCIGLRRAARAITDLYDRTMVPAGITIAQFSLLRAVARIGPAGISRLAQEVHLDRTTLARNLAPLEKAGFIRTETGEDQRSRLASLTPAGRAAIATAVPLWEQAQATMRRRVGPKKLAALTAILGEIEAATG